MVKKYTITGIVVLVAIIAGFIFLLRGCLAGYDERSAMSPALFFEKDGKSIVFTIIKYGKTTSYRSNGGSTFKSMSTNYFIQSNDALTGELIDNKKIKHNSDIKFHPVTTMGSGNGKAWVFIGELLAYDPFTLEKFADKDIIEAKNPQLKGKMPDAKNYYDYNTATDEIFITATDGVKYSLSTANLVATAIDEDDMAKSPMEAKIKALKKEEERLNELYKSYYDRYRAFNQLYSERKISANAYYDSGRNFNRQQDSINELRKKLSYEKSDLENLKDADKDRQRQIESMNSGSKSFSSICTAVDTFNGKWYGLLSSADLEKPDDRFRYRSVYTETARNKMYTAPVSVKDPTRKIVELEIGEPVKLNDAVYLQGGFLLNKATALPVHTTNEDGFIICYREKVGTEGFIMISRVDLSGKTKWTYNTKLKEFTDWIYTGKRLIILGNDNKELSSGEANLLLSIDMQNGKVVMHDYFKNSMRKE